MSKQHKNLKIRILTSRQDAYFATFSDMLYAYIKELHDIDPKHVTIRTQGLLEKEYFHAVSSTNCYVLLDNDTCVGFAILGTKPNCHPYADIYIEEFYITPEYRHKKYGHAFAKMLINESISRVCFYILPDNKPALSFWHDIFKDWNDLSNTINDVHPPHWLCWNFYERKHMVNTKNNTN